MSLIVNNQFRNVKNDIKFILEHIQLFRVLVCMFAVHFGQIIRLTTNFRRLKYNLHQYLKIEDGIYVVFLFQCFWILPSPGPGGIGSVSSFQIKENKRKLCFK